MIKIEMNFTDNISMANQLLYSRVNPTEVAALNNFSENEED
jgi:hypothetical protein